MISVLINTKANMELVTETIPFDYSRVPEMIEDTYNVLVKDLDYFELIFDALELDKKVDVIGAYDYEGNIVEWVDDGDLIKNKVARKHSKEKYKDKLKPKNIFDAEGNPISQEPYTLEEVENIQVNKFYGFGDRKIK